MADAVVVLNAGSSSIKFSIFGIQDTTFELQQRGQIEGIYTAPRFLAKDGHGEIVSEKIWPASANLDHDSALEFLVRYLKAALGNQELVGIGHRVVHGALEFSRPVRVNAPTLERLAKFIPLAPLHQPHNLAPIRYLLKQAPDVPQVACFDTSFHRSVPDIAQMFALTAELHAEGIRRYGFHGLSYEYLASVLPDYDPRAAEGRCIAYHLGNGSSMCAIVAGKSVATTMGFTAVDGLPMGTRCGTLDPGVLLYLMDQKGMDARAIEKLIYHESGLLGISGISSDMRVLLGSGETGARLALDLYGYRLRRETGSLAAAMDGVDALVFTGGIGENAAPIRAVVCRAAAWLGVELDDEANARGGPRITTAQSRVQAWVIPTNEELMIARHTRKVLSDRTM